LIDQIFVINETNSATHATKVSFHWSHLLLPPSMVVVHDEEGVVQVLVLGANGATSLRSTSVVQPSRRAFGSAHLPHILVH
jgi:hypothetical protein